jgi:hypothetical protein
MSVSNFPIPATTHGGEPVGPQYLKLQELPFEFPSIIEKVMVDGGSTRGADSTNKVRRFKLTYDGLTFAELMILRNHREEAVGNLLGFSFRYYRSALSVDELLSDCHYESFTSDHVKTWSCSCEIVIVKRPA